MSNDSEDYLTGDLSDLINEFRNASIQDIFPEVLNSIQKLNQDISMKGFRRKQRDFNTDAEDRDNALKKMKKDRSIAADNSEKALNRAVVKYRIDIKSRLRTGVFDNCREIENTIKDLGDFAEKLYDYIEYSQTGNKELFLALTNPIQEFCALYSDALKELELEEQGLGITPKTTGYICQGIRKVKKLSVLFGVPFLQDNQRDFFPCLER